MESKELLSTMMKLPLKKLKLKVIFYLPPSLLSFLLSNCFQKVRPPIPPDDLAKNTNLKKLQLGLRDLKQSQKLVLPLPSPLLSFCQFICLFLPKPKSLISPSPPIWNRSSAIHFSVQRRWHNSSKALSSVPACASSL